MNCTLHPNSIQTTNHYSQYTVFYQNSRSVTFFPATISRPTFTVLSLQYPTINGSVSLQITVIDGCHRHVFASLNRSRRESTCLPIVDHRSLHKASCDLSRLSFHSEHFKLNIVSDKTLHCIDCCHFPMSLHLRRLKNALKFAL